jgi:Tol biopolymer transport system component
MNLIPRFSAFAALLLSLVSLSSCDDNFAGAPYTTPFDSLAGRNGKIFYTVTSMSSFKGDIFVYEPDGINASPNTGAQGFLSAEPGRNELIYTKVIDFITGPELYTMPLAGGTPTQVGITVPPTHWLGLTGSAISADGKRIGYTLEDMTTGQATLYCRIEQTGPIPYRTIEVSRNFALPTTPSFSPDGEKLAFFTQGFDEFNGTIISGDDGFAVADLSQNVADVTQIESGRSFVDGEETIDWSPDGKEILFSAAGSLYLKTTQGLMTTANAQHGAFSPDGTKIVYNDISRNYQLVVDDRKGLKTPITFSSDSIAAYPQWSPDGTAVVFSSVWMGSQDALADIKVVEVSKPDHLKTIGTSALRAFWTRK